MDPAITTAGGDHSGRRRRFLKRPHLAEVVRPRLLHVLPRGGIGSLSLFALDVIRELSNYEHTIVYSTPISEMSDGFMWHAQATGADVLHVDTFIDMADWEGLELYSAAIFYDVPPGKLDIPVIYYAYSVHASYAQYDVLLAPSVYAADRMEIIPDRIIPPGIQSRMLRNLYRKRKGQPQGFSVCLLSSGVGGRYPAQEMQYLLDKLPRDMRLLISHPGEEQLPQIRRPHTFALPREIGAHWYGMQMADILIYAHGNDYTPMHGRLCVEMQASGVPVICQKRGAPAARCKDGVDIVFYERPEELLGKIEALQRNKSLMAGIGANAQLEAGWHDLTIHMGTLKGVLRGLGV